MFNLVKNIHGFTLAEVLITLALISSLFSLATVFGISFYRSEGFYSEIKTIVQVMHNARASAQNGVGGTAHGVRFFEDGYALYSGSSFASSATTSREYFSFRYPVVVQSLTMPEVQFAIRSGASTNQEIRFIDTVRPNVSSSIFINYEGTITY